MITERLSTADPRWTAILDEVRHDIYHLPRYVEISAKYEDAQPAAFYAQEGNSFCLIPLLIRGLPSTIAAPGDWRDVKSPYGYASPLIRGEASWIDKALRAFLGECKANNIVSAFLGMHPLFDIPPELEHYGKLLKHGETVYIDVTLPEETLWAQTRTRVRSYINRLRRAGFKAYFDDWSAYYGFASIYAQTMERLGADRFYRFPPQYFRDLRDALGPRLHFCSVISPRGQIASGAIFTELQGIVQYHLSGTADEFIADAPSKLMLHSARLWAKARGYKVLHLGGGRGARPDSLFHFKAGFSPLRSDFLSFRLVCDESKYAFLCRQNGTHAPDPEFFPQYRRPVYESSLDRHTASAMA